ncbi:MAG: PGF-pre-PGF domain-containing protein [Candidatus Woesearchaeota archaeon]
MNKKAIAKITGISFAVMLALGFIFYGIFVFATIDTLTPNTPANNAFTNDTTPDFNFTVIGNETTTNCTLFINATARGTNASVLNNTPTILTANASLAEGVYTWYVNCTDPAATNSSVSRTLTVDTTAPSTAHNNSGAWHIAAFNITLSPSDTGGVNYTSYQLDGGTLTNGTLIQITTEGNHTVTFYSVDHTGNVESTKTTYALLDLSIPTTVDNNNGLWHTAAFNVTLTPTDNVNGSGIAYTNYSIDGGADATGVNVVALQGNHTLTYYALDNAGRSETPHSTNMLLDIIAPTTTALGNSGAYTFDTWTILNVTVNLTCTPEGANNSGCAVTQYCTDTNNSCTPNITANNYNFTTEGVYYLRYRSSDIAGNIESTKNITIKIDRTPPVIISSTITDPDNFYSPYEPIVHFHINATDIGGSGDAGNLTVFANFSGITACETINTTYNSSTGFYEGACNASASINSTNGAAPDMRTVTITATDLVNKSAVVPAAFNLSLHNLGMPVGENACFRFGNLTTNFSQVPDFVHVNFIIHGQRNDSSACLGSGTNVWLDAAMINLSSVDMSTAAAAEHLANLVTAINATITAPNTFGDSRIFINTIYFGELNTTATIRLFYLPFTAQPNITEDIGAAGVNASVNSTWITNSIDPATNVTTGNLTFAVKGFSGYNITDNTPPIITFNTPEVDQANYSSSSKLLNVTINGTGTRLSDIILTLDGTIRLRATGANTTLNCTSKSVSGDVVECTYHATGLGNTGHTLVVNATDYGSTTGNKNTATRIFNVDTIAPVITIHSPRNTTYYTTQPIWINFSAADAQNHNDKLWYNTSTNATKIIYTNATSTNLTNGTYIYYFYANDTFGNLAAMVPVTFMVNQTNSSQQLINTTARNISANTTTTIIIIPLDNTNISAITTTAADTTTVTLDLSQRMNATGYATISSSNVTLTRDGATDYTAFIPAGTTITGSGWNGLFILPTVQTASSYTVSGGDVKVVIKLGSNTTLTLSQAVKIVLTGQHDKKAGFVNSGGTTLTEITTECTSATNSSTIIGNGECYFDDGDDLLIWTKHLTVFGSFTEDTVSGSSGGGLSSGYIAPDPSQTFSYATLRSGPTTIALSNQNIPLTSFVLTTTSDVANAKIVITRVTTPTTSFTGTVYKYVRIDHTNVSDASISGAKLSFKIEKSWFTANTVDKTQMVMYRYTGTWTMLTTTLVSEDATFAYYEAQSPGLSLFAIVLGAKQTTPSATSPTVTPAPPIATPTGNTVIAPEPTTTTPDTTAPVTKTKKSSGKSSSLGWLWVLAGIILVAIILYFVFYQRQE